MSSPLSLLLIQDVVFHRPAMNFYTRTSMVIICVCVSGPLVSYFRLQNRNILYLHKKSSNKHTLESQQYMAYS